MEPSYPLYSKAAAPGTDRLDWVRRTLIEAEVSYPGIEPREDIGFFIDMRQGPDGLASKCRRALPAHTRLYSLTIASQEPWEIRMRIRYRRASALVRLTDTRADILNVLLAIDGLIRPAYQLRYWRRRLYDDLPLFLPLRAGEWRLLEGLYGREKIAQLFEPLTPHTVIRF